MAIVGFGCAGYHAAAEARKRDPLAQIDVYTDTLLSPSNPMLTTYYVKGTIGYDAMFPFGSMESIARELNLNIHAGCPVIGLKAEEKTLLLENGDEISYDNILFATGASALVPPIDGIHLPGVIKMRTVEDACGLKEILDSGKAKSILVVGASWVGIKVIEVCHLRGLDCTLVDGAKWMFPVAAFEPAARRLEKDLENKGIHTAFEQMLASIEQEENGQLTACMKNGRRFTADLIAVCIGVRANVGFLRDSSLAIGRAIQVDHHMHTNIPGIYAAGDCCESPEKQTTSSMHIGVWANAGNQGKIAGAAMTGHMLEQDDNILLNLGHYLDVDFFSIGDIRTVANTDEVYEYKDPSFYIYAVRNGRSIKCINLIGPSGCNGILKHIFLKMLSGDAAAVNLEAACKLRGCGFPADFVDFMGGKTID